MREVVRPGAISARRWAMILAVLVVLALVALSFHGALDEFAHEQVASTTNESIVIFVLVATIKAGISAFETFQVPIVGLQPGKLLAPFKDVVEWLFSAMPWAIGSLYLQDIILGIVSSSVFKWVFLALGLAAISALLLPGWQRTRDAPPPRALALPEAGLDGFRVLMIRAFVIAAFIRFIVPVFVSIGFLLSQMILDPEIEKNKESLSSFSDQVAIDTPADSIDDLHERKTHEESELRDLEESLESLERELESARMESESLENEIAEIGPGLKGWLSEKIGSSSGEEAVPSNDTTADSVDDLHNGRRKTHEESDVKGFEESLESLGSLFPMKSSTK